ncbi:ABC transporter permease subunit [Raoultibacter phocaeensis]|uniref:ABC transporter permease subunit n=1 Tax=Raoultibacter phocaeensis TaxID=2479841 RepID=UPI00111AE299|nr:ABC transporter permease subunit [Raoultibacter phocaeensis]
MNRTLFAKEVRANLFVFVVITALLAMYVAVIVSMFDPELGKSLDMMMESMPELFAAFGMATQGSTMIEFLLNYLYGFLLVLFPLVLILIMVNKLVVRYLDRGTMSYLLATPNSRAKIILTLAGVLVALLAVLMVVVAALEIGSSEALFPGELDRAGLMQANAGLFGLWLFMAGLCFLSACAFSNASVALWAGGGVCILAYLLQAVSQVGEKLEFLKYATPLTLFDSYGLAAGEASAIAGAVSLGAMGVVFFGVGIVVFCKRDLSI